MSRSCWLSGSLMFFGYGDPAVDVAIEDGGAVFLVAHMDVFQPVQVVPAHHLDVFLQERRETLIVRQQIHVIAIADMLADRLLTLTIQPIPLKKVIDVLTRTSLTWLWALSCGSSFSLRPVFWSRSGASSVWSSLSPCSVSVKSTKWPCHSPIGKRGGRATRATNTLSCRGGRRCVGSRRAGPGRALMLPLLRLPDLLAPGSGRWSCRRRAPSSGIRWRGNAGSCRRARLPHPDRAWRAALDPASRRRPGSGRCGSGSNGRPRRPISSSKFASGMSLLQFSAIITEWPMATASAPSARALATSPPFLMPPA